MIGYASERMHTCHNYAGLWAVLNNAGIVGGGGPDEWLTIDDYKEVNCTGCYAAVDTIAQRLAST